MKPAPRIVSLLPGCTEIVCALGFESSLVGRSHECDYPETITSLPVCTRARIDSSASSAAIDRDVKSRLQNALSLYDVDVARLRELQPDLILTQAQCEVCAVSLPEVEAAVGEGLARRPEIISLSPQRFADLWPDIQRVAQALGAPEKDRELIRGLKGRCADVIERTMPVTARPYVACIEWLDPLMAAGNWIPDMVKLAGGRNLFGEGGKHSPWLEWEPVRRANPEVIVVMACGFDIARARREMPALEKHPGWSELRAVRNQRVFLADGNQFFNRPGPRLVDSLEILAELFHPKLFPAKYQNTGWQRL